MGSEPIKTVSSIDLHKGVVGCQRHLLVLPKPTFCEEHSTQNHIYKVAQLPSCLTMFKKKKASLQFLSSSFLLVPQLQHGPQRQHPGLPTRNALCCRVHDEEAATLSTSTAQPCTRRQEKSESVSMEDHPRPLWSFRPPIPRRHHHRVRPPVHRNRFWLVPYSQATHQCMS